MENATFKNLISKEDFINRVKAFLPLLPGILAGLQLDDVIVSDLTAMSAQKRLETLYDLLKKHPDPTRCIKQFDKIHVTLYD